MTENLVHVSNTPIFDQLKAERGYDPKFPPNVVRPFSMDLPKPAQEAAAVRGYMAPGAWMAKPVPTINEPEPVKLVVNFHPLDLEKDYPDEATFLRERVEEFGRKHPDATNVVMFTKEELDGTITLSIKGYEQPGVTMAEKPIFAGEYKAEAISEDLAKKQLEVYRGLSLARPKNLHNPEQTDESVNAASTDAPINPQQTLTKPLWILEDDADEE